MYVDAHVHLADPQYTGSVGTVIQEANGASVAIMLSCGVDEITSLKTVQLAKQYPGKVLAAVGIHPWTVVNSPEIEPVRIRRLLDGEGKHVLAIGEVGLDGQYPQTGFEFRKQREVFDYFLSLAKENALPIVVHSRLAAEAALEMIDAHGLRNVLLHWYSGPVELVPKIIERGYVISVGPALLYSKRLREIAEATPLDSLLTETDGPVRFHGPFEGKLTTPAFIPAVVKKLAELKGSSDEVVRDHLLENFSRVFCPPAQ